MVELNDLLAGVLAHLNLGLVRLARGDALGARRYFERAARLAELKQRDGWAAAAWGSLLAPLAMLEDWSAFDAALERSRAWLAQSGFADTDLLETLRLAQRCLPLGSTRAAALAALVAAQEAAVSPRS
jgi:hypothetical protein